MDRISHLPDEILGHILSFLPTKKVPSTSLLSKRWRNVFALVSHLDFDSSHFREPINFTVFVTNFLNLQGDAPIKKLTLKKHLKFKICVRSWICRVLERGAVDLDLRIVVYDYQNQPLPSLIFKSKTLVKLKLGCGFKIKLKNVNLPMLKILHLNSVTFNGDRDVLGTLLSHCPVLEELNVLETGWMTLFLSVSSPSLKKLCVQFGKNVNISLDVPNLVYFELTCAFGSKYRISNLDSLVEARVNIRVNEPLIESPVIKGNARFNLTNMMSLINAIKKVKVLQFLNDVLELLYFYSQELPEFDNLVCLSIKKNKNREKHGWRNLPQLIKNSPNLKTLILKGLNHYVTKKCGGACVCCDSKEKISSCLSSSRVKVLEILCYKGTKIELKQVKYFLKKLPCLELVKIRCARKPEEPIDIQELLTLPRASLNCKIQVIS